MSFAQVKLVINDTNAFIKLKVDTILKDENLSLSQKIEKLEYISQKYVDYTDKVNKIFDKIEEK